MRPLRRLLGPLLASWVALAAGGVDASRAEPGVRLVELEPPTNLGGWFVRVLPLTDTSVLVLAAGAPPPGEYSSSSELLRIDRLDTSPRIEPLPLRSANLYYRKTELSRSKRLVRLSATRALLADPGPDRFWDTGDEGAYLLDDLGGADRMRFVPLGRVFIPRMARLDHETALAGVEDADAGLVLLSRLGDAAQATRLPGLRSTGTPLVLDSRRFVAELDAGGLAVVHLDEDGVAEIQPIETEFPVVPVQTLVLSPRRLLLSSVGYIPGSRRDNLQYVAELGSSIELKPIPTPNVPAGDVIDARAGFPKRARLSATRAVLLGLGKGGHDEDDEVVLLDDLAGTPRVLPILAGRITTLAMHAPVALGEDAVAVRIGTLESSELALIRDLGGEPSIVYVPLEDPLTTPFWLDPATLLTTTDGPTPGETPEDQALAMIDPFDPAPEIETLEIPRVHGDGWFAEWPVPLGDGRLLLRAAAYPPAAPAEGLYVLDGFAGGVELETERVEVEVRDGFTRRARAVARLSLPDPARFTAAEIELRVGEAIQMLPAEAFVATRDGFLYSDPLGRAGFFRKVEYRVAEERLVVEGAARPAHEPVERTRARNLIVSLESTELYAAESLAAKRVGDRIVYRAPRSRHGPDAESAEASP